MTESVFRAHTHEDLLNALPTFFGFVPRECVIGMAVSGPRCRFGFRLRHDLPEPGEETALAAELVPHLLRNGDEGFFVFGLSADAERARTMALALRDALPPGRDWLTIWADDERLWADLPEVPPEGQPYTLDAHHEAIVRAVAEGQVIARDRSDLAAEVAPARDPRRRWLDAAHDEELGRFMARALTSDPDAFLAGECAAVADLTDRFLAGEHLTDGQLVELAVRASGRQVRDTAWLRITPGQRRADVPALGGGRAHRGGGLRAGVAVPRGVRGLADGRRGPRSVRDGARSRAGAALPNGSAPPRRARGRAASRPLGHSRREALIRP